MGVECRVSSSVWSSEPACSPCDGGHLTNTTSQIGIKSGGSTAHDSSIGRLPGSPHTTARLPYFEAQTSRPAYRTRSKACRSPRNAKSFDGVTVGIQGVRLTADFRSFGLGSGNETKCSSLKLQCGIDLISSPTLAAGASTRSIRDDSSTTDVLGKDRIRRTSS